jgi:hypothetical protein
VICSKCHGIQQTPPCDECLNTGQMNCCEGLQTQSDYCEHGISFDIDCEECNVALEALFALII